jgi:hypothetical protein
MPTLVTVFPAVLQAQTRKKAIIFINFIENPRGGSGPKHSAFCGGCFSINRYKPLFHQFSQNRGQKITNRRLFPSATKMLFYQFLSHHRQHFCLPFNLSRPIGSSISSFSVANEIDFHLYHLLKY